MRRAFLPSVLSVAALALTACPKSEYIDSIPSTVEAVGRITGDADLTSQDKREELRKMGMSETTINAYLRSDRTGNQFGGDLGSALARVEGGTYSEMTPDEVQIYGDAAQMVDSTIGTINDSQAQLIVLFFVEESLDTADNVRDYLNDPGKEVPAGISEDLLQTLFVDFDPADVEDQL